MEEILKYTGIGGLGIAIAFLLFRNIIKKNIFPQFEQTYAYKTLRLIIVLIFLLSFICIVGYLYIENKKIINNTSKSDSTVISGSNNNIIHGDNNSINFTTSDIPFYNSENRVEGVNDTLADFIEANDGKEVTLNLFINDPTFQNHLERHYYKFEGDFYFYQKEQFDIDEFNEVDNKITTFIFVVHRVSDEHFFTDENDGLKKNFYYANDIIECTVNINSINQNLLFQNRDYVTLKGKYIISYNIGGQGNNFATLEPRL